MNQIVLWGIISFVAWSSFSTWYYVTKIKDFGESGTIEIKAENQPETEARESETLETSDEIEAVTEVVAPEPLVIEEKEILFEKNRSIPIDERKVLELIGSVGEQLEGRAFEIRIHGHTCDLGTESYNYNLGQQRALSIARLFKSAGFSAENFIVESKGELENRAENDSEENRSLNRRVEIIIKTIDQ